MYRIYQLTQMSCLGLRGVGSPGLYANIEFISSCQSKTLLIYFSKLSNNFRYQGRGHDRGGRYDNRDQGRRGYDRDRSQYYGDRHAPYRRDDR